MLEGADRGAGVDHVAVVEPLGQLGLEPGPLDQHRGVPARHDDPPQPRVGAEEGLHLDDRGLRRQRHGGTGQVAEDAVGGVHPVAPGGVVRQVQRVPTVQTQVHHTTIGDQPPARGRIDKLTQIGVRSGQP